MAGEQTKDKHPRTKPREKPANFNRERFETTAEFERFRSGMKKILTISKSKLDERVREHRANSPRLGDPNAPGRKRKIPGSSGESRR